MKKNNKASKIFGIFLTASCSFSNASAESRAVENPSEIITSSSSNVLRSSSLKADVTNHNMIRPAYRSAPKSEILKR